MHTLGEKPIIYHLWDTLQTVDGIEEVILVTSPQIAELLPDNANVVIQDEPLGTAHAAFLGASVAKNENVIIVNADIPLVRKETFSTMVESSYSRLIAVTRFPFESDFGRVRFVDGLLRQIVEVSDLRDRREKEIPFVNTGVYKARKEDIVNGFPAEKLIKQGEERGEKRGEIKGTIIGTIKGKQDVLIKLLRRKFGLSSSDEMTIRSVTDEAKLDAAAEAIFDAKSKDEVLKLLGQ